MHQAAPQPALAGDALGDGVEGEDLNGRPELLPQLPEGDELLAVGVDVVLVNLVSQDHKPLPLRKLQHALHGFPRQDLARRVAGVDDGDGPGVAALLPKLADGALELRDVDAPSSLLVQVVAHRLAAQKRHRGAVEGVLRNGQHHTVIRPTHCELHHHLHGSRGAVRQKDIVGIRLEAVSLGQPLRHILAKDGMPLRVRVGAHTSIVYAREVVGGPVAHVLGVEVGLQKRRIRQASQNLPVELQRGLADGLRIPDVAGHNLLKRHLVGRRLQLFLQLLGLQQHRPPHGVFAIHDVLR
mmetsp:Transcript_63430/g.182040  ORF Transcript_63430/g.182040 Transcript_63430/m.182040 type:complete len:297 (+) Transcript_63430:569-1459(+)